MDSCQVETEPVSNPLLASSNSSSGKTNNLMSKFTKLSSRKMDLELTPIQEVEDSKSNMPPVNHFQGGVEIEPGLRLGSSDNEDSSSTPAIDFD